MPVEVLAREQVSFFQPERVPCAEADRPDAEVLAGFQDRLPDAQALRRGGKELEARLTGIARPRRKEGGPSSETVGSLACGMEGPVAWVRPHPSISGGTARGAAPQGAGGTKSRTAPEKGFRRERSTDVNRCRSSGARGPCTARQRNSSVRSARRTPSVI